MSLLQSPLRIMTDLRPRNSIEAISATSAYLRPMPTNLQRASPQPGSSKDGSINNAKTKRRCQEVEHQFHIEDTSRYDKIPEVSEPSASFIQALLDRSNQSAGVNLGTNSPSKSPIHQNISCDSPRDIWLDTVELQDKPNEENGPLSVTKAEFPTRCTLEIFIGNHKDTSDGKRLKFGEEIWRDQQIGTISTICQNSGHDATIILLPRPFIIPAEDLLVKKLSSEENIKSARRYRLDLADMYAVKIWLEALSSDSRWPPLELESRLEPNGGMQTRLRDGTSTNSDLRLCFKGVLSLDGRTKNNFNGFLKLGGLQIQTSHTLRFDLQYSLPPLTYSRLTARNAQDIENIHHFRASIEAESPYPAIRIRHLSILEARDINAENYEATEIPSQVCPILPSLTTPWTKGRLCDSVIKNVLAPGEELNPIDDELETDWRTAKHVAIIEDRADIRSDAMAYILKWNSFVTPLRLSSNYYVSRVLLEFVEENKEWLGERKARIKEFTLHATSLRLRRSIDIECFAKCIKVLRNGIETHHNSENSRRVALHGTTRAIPTKNSTDNDLPDKVATNGAARQFMMAHEDLLGDEACNKDTVDVESPFEEMMDAEPMGEENADKTALDEDEIGQATWNQYEVFRDTLKKNTIGEIKRLTLERDANEDPVDEDSLYEDASEDIDMLDLDNYFDAYDGKNTTDQPSYFHSYWQSITQRWPRIKLYHPENFGKASVIAAIAVFQGFPSDNIDRLIALHIHHCPNENIQDLVYMYYHADDVVPAVEGVCMTERKLHRIMWEAGREICEFWLTDVYRLEGGTRRTVREAIETATNADAWDELWRRIAKACDG